MDWIIPWNNNIEDMITTQNNLWYYGDQAYGADIAKRSKSQKINRWLSWNEVPIESKYATPSPINSGFAFVLPAGAKSLDDFITREPVGSEPNVTSSKQQRRDMITNQLDLLHFGKESQSSTKGDTFIDNNSWMYELKTLPTGSKGPNNISEYYREFAVIGDFSTASYVDPGKTYQIKDGILEIVPTK